MLGTRTEDPVVDVIGLPRRSASAKAGAPALRGPGLGSARDALLAAAGELAKGGCPTREAFERSLRAVIHAPGGTRDVDLLIRTGGEKRLSDFLLWESAYAELYFTDVAWPNFGEADLAAAVQSFAARERRYGGLLGASAQAAP